MREPEILKAFMAAWSAVTGQATLLPGGLHETNADRDNITTTETTDPVLTTYGILTCKEQPLARMTNGGIVREHLVQIDLKGYAGQIALMACQEAMADTTNGIPSKIPANSSIDNNGEVIDIWPAPSNPDRPGINSSNSRQTQPISIVSIAWRVQTGWAY